MIKDTLIEASSAATLLVLRLSESLFPRLSSERLRKTASEIHQNYRRSRQAPFNQRFLQRSGFLLFETMIGVAVFAVGIIVLARCVDHCIDAETVRSRDQIARVAVENRMAELMKRSVTLPEEEVREVKLEGRFTGFVIRETATPLDLKNENDENLDGLMKVEVEAIWTGDGAEQSRSLSFYVSSQ